MKIAADEIRAAWTWRMFSAGRMALFADRVLLDVNPAAQ
jgi:uncharacterized protein (DUF849 family)